MGNEASQNALAGSASDPVSTVNSGNLLQQTRGSSTDNFGAGRKSPQAGTGTLQRNTVSNPDTLHHVTQVQNSHDKVDSISLTSNASGGSFRRSWSSSCSSPVTPIEPDLTFLSEEERQKIAEVMARAHQMDVQDEERIIRIESELSQLEKQRSKGTVVDQSTAESRKCSGCAATSNENEEPLKICAKCSESVCDKCATPTHDEAEPGILCILCEKRHQLLASSGMWFHGSKQDRRQLENVFLDIAVSEKLNETSTASACSRASSVSGAESDAASSSEAPTSTVSHQIDASHDSGFDEQPRLAHLLAISSLHSVTTTASVSRPRPIPDGRLPLAALPDNLDDDCELQLDRSDSPPTQRSPRCVSPPLSPPSGSRRSPETPMNDPQYQDETPQTADMFSNGTLFGDYVGLQHAENVFTMFAQQQYAMTDDTNSDEQPQQVYNDSQQVKETDITGTDSQLQYDPSPFIYDPSPVYYAQSTLNEEQQANDGDEAQYYGPEQADMDLDVDMNMLVMEDGPWRMSGSLKVAHDAASDCESEQPVVFDLAAFAASIASDTEKMTSAIEQTTKEMTNQRLGALSPAQNAVSLSLSLSLSMREKRADYATLTQRDRDSPTGGVPPVDENLLRMYNEDYPIAASASASNVERSREKANQIEANQRERERERLTLSSLADSNNGYGNDERPDISDAQTAIIALQPPAFTSPNKDGNGNGNGNVIMIDSHPLSPLSQAQSQAQSQSQQVGERERTPRRLPEPPVDGDVMATDGKLLAEEAQDAARVTPSKRKKLPVPAQSADAVSPVELESIQVDADGSSSTMLCEERQHVDVQVEGGPSPTQPNNVQLTNTANTLVSTIIQASAAIVAASIEQQIKNKQPEVPKGVAAQNGSQKARRILPIPPDSGSDSLQMQLRDDKDKDKDKDKSGSDKTFGDDHTEPDALERLSWSSPLERDDAADAEDDQDAERVRRTTIDSDQDKPDDLHFTLDNRFDSLTDTSLMRPTQRVTSRSFEELSAFDYSLPRVSLSGKARSVISNYASRTDASLALAHDDADKDAATLMHYRVDDDARSKLPPTRTVDYTNTDTVLDIDLEILRKESKIRQLEREYALRKREIDEAIRLQTELRKVCDSLELGSNALPRSPLQPLTLTTAAQPGMHYATLPRNALSHSSGPVLSSLGGYPAATASQYAYAAPHYSGIYNAQHSAGGPGTVLTTLDALEPVQPILVHPAMPHGLAHAHAHAHSAYSYSPQLADPAFQVPLQTYAGAQIPVTEVDGLSRFVNRESYTSGEYFAHRTSLICDSGDYAASVGRLSGLTRSAADLDKYPHQQTRLIPVGPEHRRYASPHEYNTHSPTFRSASPRSRPANPSPQFRSDSPSRPTRRDEADLYSTVATEKRRAKKLEYEFDAPYESPPVRRSAKNNHANAASSRLETQAEHAPTQNDTAAKTTQYPFPVKRLLLTLDGRDRQRGFGLRVVGGRRTNRTGELGAYIAAVDKRDLVNSEVRVGDRVLEWNGIALTNKTYEQVQQIVSQELYECELEIVVYSESMHSANDDRAAAARSAEHTKITSLRQATNMQREEEAESPTEQRTRERDAPISKESATDMRDRVEPPVTLNRSRPVEAVNGATESRGGNMAPKKTTESAQTKSQQVNAASRLQQTQGTNRQQSNSSISDSKYTQPSYEQVNFTADTTQFGEIELQVSHDDYDQSLTVHVSRAKGLIAADINGLSDPFVKVELFPLRDPEQVGQTRAINNTLTPEWQQTLVLFKVHKRNLRYSYLNVTAFDYDRFKENDVLGQVLIPLGDKRFLDNKLHWYTLHAVHEPLLEWLPPDVRTAVENERTKALSKSEASSKKKPSGANPKEKK